MLEQNINDLPSIIASLAKIDLFRTFNQSALNELAASMTLISLGGGETLIQQGDADGTLYILLQGRLRVYVDSENNTENIIAEITAGQIVGEIAMLTGRPRTASVRAIRDSLLLKLKKESFETFEEKYPEEVVQIAKTSINRLLDKPRLTQAGENIISLIVVPAGGSDHRPFTQKLIEELNKIKPTLLITHELCTQHFGKDVSSARENEEDYLKLSTWLYSLEQQYGYLIYELDKQLTPWTERCIRQADRVILVAEPSKKSTLNEIEARLVARPDKAIPCIDMVFVHPPNTSQISGSFEWLKSREIYDYYHIESGSQKHFDKFIRILTGRSFGLVLSGGGARGLIHLGTLKALEELKIPIDFIAGTGMGAIVAGSYAAYGIQETEKWIKDYIAHYRRDYTFPIISLLSGKYVTTFFQRVWGNVCIEDLWTRFFCVSTNLTRIKANVHDKGLMWLAVRSSTSTPAVYPPIYNDKGEMLVEGGIINDMPVDLMRKLVGGGKVIGVRINSYARAPLSEKRMKHAWASGWELLLQRFNPFSKARREEIEYNDIFSILTQALTISSDKLQKFREKEADYLIKVDAVQYARLELEAVHKFIDLGYQEGLKQLSGLSST